METDTNFTTLVRDTPWRRQIAGGTLLALLFGSIGGGMLYATHNYYGSWNWDDGWLLIVFGAVFSALGALMVLLTVQQLLAVHTPECTVAICPAELGRASDVQLRIRQPGPVRLRSLHARLLCEMSTRHTSETQRSKTYWSTEYPHDDRILTWDTPQDIPAGGMFENVAAFRVPSDSPPTGKTENRVVALRIAFLGLARPWAGF